jgi:NAD(P)-dependent dehydrogenase (short-subunit alcohol dehydrogenase family)
MADRLRGKVAVITGGASGIGEATARLFASEGARVLIADRNASRGPWVASEIGGSALFVETDVRSGEDVQGMFTAADEAWGRIDIIYNNAGVGPTEGNVRDCPEKTYDLISDVNIRGVWLGMKHGIPHLERAGGGSIIATASVAGLTGLAGIAAYCASKGAVIAMVRAAAGEWASKGIRINCICPGGIATGQGWLDEEQIEQTRQNWSKLHPLGRSGEAIDIAHAALFLASDASSIITGQQLVVDGGWTGPDGRYDELTGRDWSQV